MTLHLYFARRFLSAFASIFAIFAIIMFLLDMVEQLRKFDSEVIGFTEIVSLSALNVPQSIYQILPLIVILATLTLFLGLARSSEMVVTRAAGRSALRALVPPVLVALLIGVLAVAALNPIVAATTKEYEARVNRYTNNEAVLSISQEGLWLRQGGPEGQTVIRASHANLDGTRLLGTTFMTFSNDGTAIRRIEARTASLTSGAWELVDAKEWRLHDSDNPERDAIFHEHLNLPSELTRDQIRDSFGTPDTIPIWDLPAFIESLDRAGFSASRHKVWLQMELALPLLLVAMVMVGACFTLRHTRFGHTGTMVLGAILSGFTLFFIRNFAQVLGESGQIPGIVAAWSPPVAAICLSLALLLHLEDG